MAGEENTEVTKVSVVGVVPTLDLSQIYTAVRIDDEEADAPFILEGTASGGLDLWIGPIDLSPRICIQRDFYLWGDTCIKISFGIDTRSRLVGPVYLTPTPTKYEFIRYWVKRAVYIRIQNTDSVNTGEYHVVAFTVQPKLEDWLRYWKPAIEKQVERLKISGLNDPE